MYLAQLYLKIFSLTLFLFDFSDFNQISCNDGLPQKICTDCFSKLLTVSSFRLQCQEAQAILSNIFDKIDTQSIQDDEVFEGFANEQDNDLNNAARTTAAAATAANIVKQLEEVEEAEKSTTNNSSSSSNSSENNNNNNSNNNNDSKNNGEYV